MPCCRSFHFSTVADVNFVIVCSGTFNSSSSAVICCSIAAFALPVALVALLLRSLIYALISCMSFSTAATNSSFSFFAAFSTAPTASLACCLTSPAPVFGSGTPSFLSQGEIPTASPRTINHDKRRFIWKLLAFGLLEFPRCTGARLAPFETGCATLDRLAQLAPCLFPRYLSDLSRPIPRASGQRRRRILICVSYSLLNQTQNQSSQLFDGH